MAFDAETGDHHQGGDQQGHPTAFGKLLQQGDAQDAHTESQPRHMDAEMLFPFHFFFAVFDKEPGHTELGEGKGQKDVDGIHHHQGIDGPMGIEEQQQGRHRHQDHPVCAW